MSDTQQPTKVKATDHDSYGTFSIIGFLLPFVGFIVGIVYLTKEEKLDKKLGEHMIVIGILGGILWSLLWVAYAGSLIQ